MVSAGESVSRCVARGGAPMLKRCQLCGEQFSARWRNDPDVCPGCAVRAHLSMCPACLRVSAVERDPAQLDAFGADAFRVTAVHQGARDTADFYAPPARSAPRAVQLRNPFH